MTNRKDPDVCVIGAGLAGGLVAFELARRGVGVVVLEAGPRLDPASRIADFEKSRARGEPLWPSHPARDRFTSVGTFDYRLNDLRVKAVGGTTLHWTAYTTRMLESDFEERRRFGVAADWPIRYDELEPYYGRAERMLNVAGAGDPFASHRSTPFPFPAFPFSHGDTIVSRAARRLGIEFHQPPYARNAAACQAYGTCGSDVAACPIRAQYTAEIHLEAAEQTGHARIVSNAAVRRLNVDASGRASSVTFTDAEGRDREQRSRVVVLAAHAVESARLLLLSANGRSPDGLANANGAVGRHFMDHPMWALSGRVKEPVFPFRIGFVTAATHQFASGPDRATDGAFQIIVDNMAGPMPADLARASRNWGTKVEEEVRNAFGRRVGLIAFVEQFPDPVNSVRLDPDVRDAFGDPVPRISYGVGPFERHTARRADGVMRRILDELGATAVEERLDGLFGVGGHQMGTCRMGDDPDTSVVDATLRTHEIPNLYVVGSSVFVTAGALNPSLTIAALAIRLADTLTSTAAG